MRGKLQKSLSTGTQLRNTSQQITVTHFTVISQVTFTKITSCSAFLALLPPRPTRALGQTTPTSRTAHLETGAATEGHGPRWRSRTAELFPFDGCRRRPPFQPGTSHPRQRHDSPRGPRQQVRGSCRQPAASRPRAPPDPREHPPLRP